MLVQVCGDGSRTGGSRVGCHMFVSSMSRPLSIVLTCVSAGAVVLATSGAAQAATAVAVWHMNDSGSTMTDSSGNNLNGTLKNVTTGQAGVSGTAFAWNVKPSVVTVKHSTKLNPGTAPFTVSLHVKFAARPSSSVGDFDLLRKGLSSTAGGEYKVEILRSGFAFCLFKGPGGQVSLSHGPNLANNAWHTITCNRSGSTLRLTIDGASFTKSGATGNIANTAPLYVGAKNPNGGDQYTGVMDEVTITSG
jgi:hypothetical protein